MKNYDDLYAHLRHSFGGELFIDLDQLDYLDEIELHCIYRDRPFVLCDLLSGDLKLQFRGDPGFMIGAVVPRISEFMGEGPVCQYDAYTFETMEKRYTTIAWNHNKNLAEDLEKDPVLSTGTVARNIKAFEQPKKKEKKGPHVQ